MLLLRPFFIGFDAVMSGTILGRKDFLWFYKPKSKVAGLRPRPTPNSF